MSLEDNKKLIQRLYEEGINRHDATAAAAFYSPEALNHGRRVGREGMRAVFEALFSTFPDFRYEIDESTAEADRVVCKVTMTGTHMGQPTLEQAFTGMLTGVTPTGKKVRVHQFHLFRVAEGEIAAHEAVRDDLSMLLQLGLLRRPG
ncbi:MAG TPA: ester cyclase [Burkholderiales bacterium]|nr:ester cyclase [Burkholderiales bacterium]